MLQKIRHNLAMKILSVLIAVLFWFVVYTNENPIETRQLEIALTPINIESLADKNIRVLNEYEEKVEITIKGRKTEIDQVSASDFTAYLDFGSIHDDEASYIEVTDFKYLGDRNIISDFTGSGRIGLSLDRIIAGEIPIHVEIVGETAEGFVIVGDPDLYPARFSATDIEGLVGKIDSAVVTVDVSGMKGTETQRIWCTVYDEDGNEISEFRNDTAVDVTVKIAKNVPIDVKLEGVPADDHIAAGAVSDPINVLVSGPEEELMQIEKVSTLPINMENAEESFVVTTGLQTLPAGVGYVGSGEVDVSVAIEPLIEKTLIFNPYNINIRYGSDDKDYQIQSTNVELIIKGRQGILATITSSTIKAYIEVNKTSDGEQSLPLRFENLDSVEQLSFPLVEVYIRTEKNFPIYSEDIFIENKNSGKYDYELLNAASSLKVLGLSDDIELITLDNLKPVINAEGLEAGTHTVTISVNLPEGVEISGELTTLLKISDK